MLVGLNRRILFAAVCCVLCIPALHAQGTPPGDGKKLYDQLHNFALGDAGVKVENLVLQRDRAVITLTSGNLYFEAPVNGHVYGAVFIGEGKFHADPPPIKFEQENVKRLLNADNVESDFKTAVLRFTDDTFDLIGKGAGPLGVSGDAQKLAGEFELRMLKEEGANIAARLAVSVLNRESPGVFVAQFDKGRRGRFSFVFDPQGRIPDYAFEINGGEKGLIFKHDSEYLYTEVWTAFYSQDDFARGRVEFSDVYDQVLVRHHDLDIDLRDPFKWLRYDDRMDLESHQDGLRVIQFQINSGLGEFDNYRLKHGMKLKYAKSENGQPLDAVQEDWDNTLTVFLPAALSRGQKISIDLRLEGEAITGSTVGTFQPMMDAWYPLHGYLQRSTYRLVFHHSKLYTPVALGNRVQKAVAGGDSGLITEWKIDTPVPFYNFSMGDFKEYDTTTKVGDTTIPIEYYAGLVPIKSDFVAGEMGNALRYYSALYGPYPYDGLRAVYNPRPYGQGMATFLLLAGAQNNSKYVYEFISHEVGHQWWGDLVAWRSYRDQWLSEGFAEYSALLYTGQRDKGAARQDLIDTDREALRAPPFGMKRGVQKGHLTEIGPIILGHRVSTSETSGAYQTLIYYKGALILRMLHFLFTDPTTRDDKPFFDMMKNFIDHHRGGAASTEDFVAAANEQFVNTPIAKRYHLTDLNWFFQQWVYSAYFPTYRFEYQLEAQPDGTAILKGTLYQEDIPETEKWFMPLPIVFGYGKDRVARGTIAALGPKTPVTIKLPSMPEKVELDPDMFVLSVKTTAQREH